MSQRFLRVGPVGLGVGLSILVAACGGKVIVDTPGGTGGKGTGTSTGGHGGSTSTSTFVTSTTGFNTSVTSTTGPDSSVVSVGPGPTTGVGPMMCDCQQACGILNGCGIQIPGCMGLCNQASPQLRDCVCANAASCNVKQCLMFTGNGTGVGPSAVSSSTGGGPGAACAMCANGTVAGQCGMQAAACNNDPGCTSILQCHQMCGWTPACKQQCEGANPGGVNDFDALIDCAVCQSCGMECQGTQLFNDYCFLPP